MHIVGRDAELWCGRLVHCHVRMRHR
jgi:hypothetical protein